MVNRPIIYPAQMADEKDILRGWRQENVAIGRALEMLLGKGTYVSGFTCTPGQGLNVVVGVGSATQMATVDANYYSTLPPDQNPLLQQYTLDAPVTIAVTAGASQIVYAQLQVNDVDGEVQPFYNSDNPAITFAGTGNDGKPLPSVRAAQAVIGIGTTIPEGAVPLWNISTTPGATVITPGSITKNPNTPWYNPPSNSASYLDQYVKNSPYYPRRFVAPPLSFGKRPMFNDTQGPIQNPVDNSIVAFDLFTEDVDVQQGTTTWMKRTSYDNGDTWINGGIWIDLRQTPYISAESGSILQLSTDLGNFKKGTVLYYLTTSNDGTGTPNQTTILMTAPDLDTPPVFNAIVGTNPGDNAHYRDPMVKQELDSQLNPYLRQMITTENGFIVTTSKDGLSWQPVENGVINITNLMPILTPECVDWVSAIKPDGTEQDFLIFGGYLTNDVNNTLAYPNTYTWAIPITWNTDTPVIDPNIKQYPLVELCLDNGDGCYAFRSGQLLDGTIVGQGCILNWTWQYGLPVPNFLGCQTSLRKFVCSINPTTGYAVLGTTPLDRPWKKTMGNQNVSVLGYYADVGFKDLPPAFELSMNFKPQGKSWPASFYITMGDDGLRSYTIRISGAGDGTRDGKPYVEIAKDTYGAQPQGDTGQWNSYFRTPIYDTTEVNIRVRVDRYCAEVFVNGISSCTMPVLWSNGSRVFRIINETLIDWTGKEVSVYPDGSQGPTLPIMSNFTLQYDEQPHQVFGGLTFLEADSRYLRLGPEIVGTYTNDVTTPVPQIGIDSKKGPFFKTDLNPDPGADDKVWLWQNAPDGSDNVLTEVAKLKMLVSQLSGQVTSLSSNVTSNTDAISAETKRATNKETMLQQNIETNQINVTNMINGVENDLKSAVSSFSSVSSAYAYSQNDIESNKISKQSDQIGNQDK